ncbi:hypothetical protein [Aeromonas phage phiA014S]|uniref:Uncharacterized protein n=1 Tax=Aeromonas phage phiA014S TaxID=3119845 RepID=A0ABZ2CLX1_9CAUD
MSAIGKKYIIKYNQAVIYTIAPQGSIICKRIGTFKWIPSALTREQFDQRVKSGELVPYQGV